MDKFKASSHVKENLIENDTLIGVFQAQEPFKIWLFFIIGPLAVLSMRINIIAASDKGMYFHRLNFFGKFTDFDFFTYQEINQVKIGKGWLQRPMVFLFFNGRKLKVKAQLKGVNKIAKLSDKVQRIIEQKIQVAP
jgi:hypothetical protein